MFFDGGGFNNYFQDISHIPFLGLLLHPNSKGPHLFTFLHRARTNSLRLFKRKSKKITAAKNNDNDIQ